MTTDGSEFAGRVALVTGASSGIGAATARLFAARGATVIVNSRASAQAGEAVAADVGGTYLQADIADPDTARRLVADAAALHGRLDILVNNAGTTEFIDHDDLESATPEIWHRLYATNVVGPFVLATAARPWLAAAKGAIVNTGSVSGIRPIGSSIPYGVSKAALHHLTVMLAATLAPDIRVNAVAPGFVDSPWTEGWESARADSLATLPLRRVAAPEDVAALIALLASAASVTGEVWSVDGGAKIKR